MKIVENGIVFIEIDYLHESSPTLTGIPNYRTHQNRQPDADSQPYRILIVDPRPDVADGVIRVNQFGVDDPLPLLTVALRGADVLTLDLNGSYNAAIQEALYGFELVDYSRLPQRFERYSLDDQAAIAARMLAVVKAQREGTDLENGPFAKQSIPLEDALKQLEKIVG